MLNSLENPHTWQQSLLSSFVAMTEADNGDFMAIDRLVAASRDPKSLYLTVQHLSQHPQSQIALANRQPLGSIDLAALHQLPIDTLGYHYAHHMSIHQLKQLEAQPAASESEFIDTHDPSLSVIGARCELVLDPPDRYRMTGAPTGAIAFTSSL